MTAINEFKRKEKSESLSSSMPCIYEMSNTRITIILPDAIDAILVHSLLDHFGWKDGNTFTAFVGCDETFLSVPNTDATVRVSCAFRRLVN